MIQKESNHTFSNGSFNVSVVKSTVKATLKKVPKARGSSGNDWLRVKNTLGIESESSLRYSTTRSSTVPAHSLAFGSLCYWEL
eukprot:scaffold11190_cov32-Attheya_sp.AAC.2